jgi:hypothetical protein
MFASAKRRSPASRAAEPLERPALAAFVDPAEPSTPCVMYGGASEERKIQAERLAGFASPPMAALLGALAEPRFRERILQITDL